MDDFKASLNELLMILLSIVILMVMVFFVQSIEWNKTLKSREKNIVELRQKITDLERQLTSAQDTIVGHESSIKNTADDLESARQIIGKLEFERQKSQKEIAGLESILQEKDTEAAKFNERLSEIKKTADRELAAKDGRNAELEKIVADQKRKLAAAKITIQRLEESEKALQNEIQAAAENYSDLNRNYQSVLEELTTLKEQN